LLVTVVYTCLCVRINKWTLFLVPAIDIMVAARHVNCVNRSIVWTDLSEWWQHWQYQFEFSSGYNNLYLHGPDFTYYFVNSV